MSIGVHSWIFGFEYNIWIPGQFLVGLFFSEIVILSGQVLPGAILLPLGAVLILSPIICSLIQRTALSLVVKML